VRGRVPTQGQDNDGVLEKATPMQHYSVAAVIAVMVRQLTATAPKRPIATAEEGAREPVNRFREHTVTT
jgi:hypothetical protein